MENKNDIRKKLEELLPDYAFQSISDHEKLFFESNIKNFPDLQKELTEVKSVFCRIDKMNLNDDYSQRSRNISVKVLDKINHPGISNRSFLFRFVAPVFGLALLTVLIINTGVFNKESAPDFANYNPPSFLTDNEYASLINDEEKQEYQFIKDDELDELETEDYTSLFSQLAYTETESDDDITFTGFESFTGIVFTGKELNNLAEEDFLKLYEEMKNVDFNS